VSTPELSVVICSYNRRVLVERAIRSLTCQSVDASRFEVLLVDNNSRDGTLEWAIEFAKEFSSLRVFRETEQGLSFARNRGAREARAPFVAFLDDDAVAVPEWVEALLATLAASPPGTVAVGGRIELDWSRPRPFWLPDEARGWLGYFTLPAERKDMRAGTDNLRGGNMVIERAALVDVGLFDTRLGRSKEGLMGNEEVEFQRRLERLGRPMAYAHDAVIYHLVHPERLHPRWFFRRAYDQGRSDVRLESALGESTHENTLLRSVWRTAYNGTRSLLAIGPRRKVRFALRATAAVGAFVERARMRREPQG